MFYFPSLHRTLSKKWMCWLSICALLWLTSCRVSWITAIQEGGVSPTTFDVEVKTTRAKNLLFVPVTIAGKTYRFLLDTGAPFSISKQVQEAMQYKIISRGNMRDSDNNRKKIDWVTVDNIEIGGVSFKGLSAFVGDFQANPVLACLRIDGIIGSTLMQHCQWTIDPQKQTLRLFSESVDSTQYEQYIPFSINNQYSMFIPVPVGHLTVKKVLVDYGSNGGLQLREDQMDVLSNKGVLGRMYTETGAQRGGIIGSPVPIHHGTGVSDSVMIGNQRLKNTPITTGAKASIGNGLLNAFVVTIDWASHRLYLTHVPKEKSPKYVAGLKLSIDAEGVYIQSILEESDAFLQGLRPKMRVSQIDSIYFNRPQSYCDYVFYTPKNTVTLQVTDSTGTAKKYVVQRTLMRP